MGRLLITENERKEILTKYGVIDESTMTISQLPPAIRAAINSLNKPPYNLGIKDKHIQKEFDQEGNFTLDSGGVNPQALARINELIVAAKQAFSGSSTLSNLGIVSHYRSYTHQVRNFGRKALKKGVDITQSANTIPGFSQHHTGKAFDIFSTEPTWWTDNSDVKRWVEENCGKYGFKVTYTELGKIRIPEPWHLYYIGKIS